MSGVGQSLAFTSALRRTPHGRAALYVVAVGLVALAYYLAGRVGLELAYLDGAVAAAWPPAGLGLAVALPLRPADGAGHRDRRSAARGLLDAARHGPRPDRSGTRGARRGRPAAAPAHRRARRPRSRARRSRLHRLRAGRGVVSAAFGPTALRLGDVIATDELGRVFRTWTLGDAAGVLVVAPALLTWASRGHRRHAPAGPRRGRASCSSLLVALAELPPQRDVPYVVFPALLWAALRFGPRGAATAILIVCSITVWNTAQDDGAVRARLAHRQPARDAALHRDRGGHVAAPRRGDRRAHPRGARAGGDGGGAARARRRAGGAAKGRHARGRRRAAEPSVRAGDRGGRASARTARRERDAVRRGAHRHRRRRVERARAAALPGRREARHRRRHGRRSESYAAAAPRAWTSTTRRPASWPRRSAEPATGAPSRRRSTSAGGCGACWPRRARRTSRCRTTSSSGCATSPISSRRRSRTRTRTRSWPPRARVWWRSGTPSASGSSAISTTAPSSGSSRSPSGSAWRRRGSRATRRPPASCW